MNEDCVFCKIINDEIAADKIYEDANVLAFMDIRPVSRGHALVIPKRHASDIVESDNTTIADAIIQAKRIAVAIQRAMGADGFTITTNRGEAAGQTVFHLHFHIIPRYKKDGLQPWQHQEIEPATRTEIAELIKKSI
jgi:histidine triad (HIT) family protein